MFSTNMKTLYRRWLILGLLLMCLGVFGFSDITQTASAAPCYQECENNLKQCIDYCQSECAEESDANCTQCKFDCDNTYWNCVSVAVHCGNNYTYSAQCEYKYQQHCPIMFNPMSGNYEAKCDHPDTHYNYHQLCKTIGNQECVACPDHQSGGFQCQIPNPDPIGDPYRPNPIACSPPYF